MGRQYGVGIDIGSTCAKTVAIDSVSRIIFKDMRPTGWNSVDTAEAVLRELPETVRQEAGLVATGYGRVSVPGADRCITEISCHARGAVHLFGTDTLTVLDIGGQDTKIIRIEGGAVSEFVMNDKCSAGTGRFLEVMCNTLSVRAEELMEMAGRGARTRISSLCTVFAESEVIGLIGCGKPREDIAWGVIDSIVEKVKTQAGRLPMGSGPVCLTGGLCGFPYIREKLEGAFGREVWTNPMARYAGALGAALYALT